MGKTSKPLTIFALPPLDEWEEFQVLAAQGHDIRRTMVGEPDDTDDCDLIIGPAAWFMDEAHRKYLPLAIKEARRRRYGKGLDDPPPPSS